MLNFREYWILDRAETSARPGRVMVSQLLDFDEQQTLGLHQPNDVVFRVTLVSSGIEVCPFIKGEGPFAGV